MQSTTRTRATSISAGSAWAHTFLCLPYWSSGAATNTGLSSLPGVMPLALGVAFFLARVAVTPVGLRGS